ncbi:MAG: hypothetical protein ACRDDY_08075 [Clostridium sp.]|uniref:hypothetical protein n=1 Tax=Clostridium sp. TaxID=1506 RepID=UPI003EE66671
MKSYVYLQDYKKIIIGIALVFVVAITVGVMSNIGEEKSMEYSSIENLGNNQVMENYFWNAINVTTNGVLLGTSKLAGALGNSSESGKIINLGKFREITKKKELKNNFKSDLQKVAFSVII